VIRKAELSFRPSKCQAVLLERLLGACCEVYNAGLQERRDAWRIQATSIRVYDQFNQITFLRGVRDDVLVWGIQPLRGRCAACGHTAATNRDGTRFVCGNPECGHTNHADINAAENIAALGHDCETAWQTAGRPPMVRPKPRLRRRQADNQPAPAPPLAA
jgi:hypothetical protein